MDVSWWLSGLRSVQNLDTSRVRAEVVCGLMQFVLLYLQQAEVFFLERPQSYRTSDRHRRACIAHSVQTGLHSDYILCCTVETMGEKQASAAGRRVPRRASETEMTSFDSLGALRELFKRELFLAVSY